jgi:hypothetical protein
VVSAAFDCKSRIVQQVFDKYKCKKEVFDHLMNRKTRLVVQLTIGLFCHLSHPNLWNNKDKKERKILFSPLKSQHALKIWGVLEHIKGSKENFFKRMSFAYKHTTNMFYEIKLKNGCLRFGNIFLPLFLSFCLLEELKFWDKQKMFVIVLEHNSVVSGLMSTN